MGEESDGAPPEGDPPSASPHKRRTRKWLLVIAGVIVVAATVGVVAVLARQEPEIKPKDEVDLDALRTELIEQHGAQTAINMDQWYDMVVENCNDDLSEWRTAIALSIDQGLSSLNDLWRTSMKYICPSRAHLVDDAIAEIQESNREANLACTLPRNMRTSQQQSLAEALGCD